MASKKKKKKRKLSKMQFSKVCIIVLIIYTAIMIAICVFMNRMENLAEVMAGSLGLEFLGYVGRAFFGKKEEESNKLTKYLAELEIDTNKENRCE